MIAMNAAAVDKQVVEALAEATLIACDNVARFAEGGAASACGLEHDPQKQSENCWRTSRARPDFGKYGLRKRGRSVVLRLYLYMMNRFVRTEIFCPQEYS
jgi:hypothetical protein